MAGRLEGQIALVAGGTRGAGRGIAIELGALGATVYVTGRTTRSTTSPVGRPETIEETAELVDAAGGRGIPVRVDHLDRAQVAALGERIRAEHGRLDILINDVWGGEHLMQWGPFWEQDLDKALRMWRNGTEAQLITAHALAPLLVEQKAGLIVAMTDGLAADGFRGSVFYDLAKNGICRMAMGMADDLRPHGVHVVAVTPGFLRSEEMLEVAFGVAEANWRDGAAKDANFLMSESPRYVGRGIAALAADPDRGRWHGQSTASWLLMREYGFTDLDGSQPDWGAYAANGYAEPDRFR